MHCFCGLTVRRWCTSLCILNFSRFLARLCEWYGTAVPPRFSASRKVPVTRCGLLLRGTYAAYHPSGFIFIMLLAPYEQIIGADGWARTNGLHSTWRSNRLSYVCIWRHFRLPKSVAPAWGALSHIGLCGVALRRVTVYTIGLCSVRLSRMGATQSFVAASPSCRLRRRKGVYYYRGTPARSKGDSILLTPRYASAAANVSRPWGQGRDSNPRLTAYEAVLEPSPVTLSRLIRTGFSQRSGSNRRRLVLKPPQPRRRKKGGIHNLRLYYNSFTPFCQYGKTELYAKKASEIPRQASQRTGSFRPGQQGYRGRHRACSCPAL